MEMNENYVTGLGRTNIDLIFTSCPRLPSLGEEIYSEDLLIELGGGITGEAYILSRLNIPIKAYTFIGKGGFADTVNEKLLNSTAEIIDLHKGSKSCVNVSVDIICDNDRSFVTHSPEVSIPVERGNEIKKAHENAKIAFIYSDFPSIYDNMSKGNTTFIFDCGWFDDMSLKNESFLKFIKLADYYLPNKKEALKITNTSNIEDASLVLMDYFDDVIIKMDKDGTLIRNKDGIKIIPPAFKISAIDTTGAGDAFKCGFTYGLYHGYNITDCVKLGNITGAMCVKGYGCTSNALTEKELLQKFQTIYRQHEA